MINEGDLVRVKGQEHCPIMTVERLYKKLNRAICVWFRPDGLFNPRREDFSITSLEQVVTTDKASRGRSLKDTPIPGG